MKRGRSIHEPSAYRNGESVNQNHQKKLLRPQKRRKCAPNSTMRECPLTALNIQRRVLQYAPQDQVLCIIPNRRQISLEERNATWITMKEFRRMQKETAQMIESMEANSKHYESFSSLSAASDLDPPPITPNSSTIEEDEQAPVLVPASPSSSNEEKDTTQGTHEDEVQESSKEDDDIIVCLRGLEQHTKLYLATKHSVQRLMHETVAKIRRLEAQDNQSYGHVLAQLCQVCSATAIENARVLGDRDAQEAAAVAAGHYHE